MPLWYYEKYLKLQLAPRTRSILEDLSLFIETYPLITYGGIEEDIYYVSTEANVRISPEFKSIKEIDSWIVENEERLYVENTPLGL